MSIDRIGKPPSTAPAAGPTISPASGQRPFSVREAGPAAGATPVTAPSPAEQVRRGELSIDDYLDLRVREATRHLEGRLGPEALTKVQETLRLQLAHDPMLQELVKSATGQPPPGEP